MGLMYVGRGDARMSMSMVMERWSGEKLVEKLKGGSVLEHSGIHQAHRDSTRETSSRGHSREVVSHASSPSRLA